MIAAADPRVGVVGRTARTRDRALRVGYPGVTFRLRFEGSSLGVRVESTSEHSYLMVSVDGQTPRMLKLSGSVQELSLASGLGAGEHEVEVLHATETWLGIVTIHAWILPRSGQLLSARPASERRLLVIGDSVSSGEAVKRTADCVKDSSWWDPANSYGMVLARALHAEVELVCYGGRGLLRDWQGRQDVLNAPQFFELAVPDPEQAEAWEHARSVPDFVLVSLGTNDFNLGLGPLPAEAEFVSRYVQFVRRIREVYPQTQVWLTAGAMVNDDADPARPQRSVLNAYLARTVRELHDAAVGVAESSHFPGDACDAHPTRAQHAQMAAQLLPQVRRILSW